MEMIDQLHALATLPSGIEPPVPTGMESWWAPEPVWTLWRRIPFVAPAGRPAHSLVTILTELPRL